VVTQPERETRPGIIRAVIFDKDGTLFEFEKTWSSYCDSMLDFMAAEDAPARQILAEASGYDPVERRFRPGSPVIGSPIEDICAVWASRDPNLDLQALLDESARVIAELRPEPVCDLQDLVAKLEAAGLALGLVTNDLEQAARAQLADAGVLDRFAFVSGSDSGIRTKPEPDTILAFCELTGLLPSEVAMVGDSLHDLHAARAAGAGLAIGVLTGPAGHSDLAPRADHVLGSVMELPGLLIERTAG